VADGGSSDQNLTEFLRQIGAGAAVPRLRLPSSREMNPSRLRSSDRPALRTRGCFLSRRLLRAFPPSPATLRPSAMAESAKPTTDRLLGVAPPCPSDSRAFVTATPRASCPRRACPTRKRRRVDVSSTFGRPRRRPKSAAFELSWADSLGHQHLLRPVDLSDASS
jgi:hypothetical protein